MKLSEAAACPALAERSGTKGPTAPPRSLPSPGALHSLPHWFKNLKEFQDGAAEH